MKTDFKLSYILEIIKNSQKKEKIIRQEFSKMIEFFTNNEDDFINVLLNTKDMLENSETELSDTEEKSLERIYKILDSEELNIKSYFNFLENLLLNDIKKIFLQIRDKEVPVNIKENEICEIFYYDIDNLKKEIVDVNVDSKISMKRIELSSLDFLLQYQMLNN